MIKKIFSVLGFVSLFILGAPANGYSDSLPGNVGQVSYGAYEQCAKRGVGFTNLCNSVLLTVFFPVQSRAAGYWTFYATGPQVGAQNSPDCWVTGSDFNGNVQWQGYSKPNGMVSLGRFYVYSNTVITYQCNLSYNQSLYTVDWSQG